MLPSKGDELVSHPEAPQVLPELPAGLSDGFPAQGNWTYEDYCRIPDDGQRYEVIRGVLYVSPAPRTRHQRVIAYLLTALNNFVTARQLGEVLTSPIDVLLPGLASVVQPDILFVSRDRAGIVEEKYLRGAPDLVVEVLSPSNPGHDRKTKLEVYAEAGVREYWIVDPDARSIDVHVLESRAYRLDGRYGTEAAARSRVLDGFEVGVARVCPQ
jgi:Uma2 family endonuclease